LKEINCLAISFRERILVKS